MLGRFSHRRPRLGRTSQRMAVAPLRAELGRSDRALWRGRDGGREATYVGDLDWSKASSDASTRWAGYTVFQAKFHVNAGVGSKDEEGWLKAEIRKELAVWRAGGRMPLPRNIVFITNVRLSSTPVIGGIDSVTQYLEDQLDAPLVSDDPTTALRARGFKHFKVIHRDTLIAQLNVNAGVRLAFNLVSEADLALARWAQSFAPVDPTEMRDMLAIHGESALKADRFSRFSVSGTSTRAMPLSSWVVDLPASVGGRKVRAIAEIVRRASLNLQRSLVREGPRHVVLTRGAEATA